VDVELTGTFTIVSAGDSAAVEFGFRGVTTPSLSGDAVLSTEPGGGRFLLVSNSSSSQPGSHEIEFWVRIGGREIRPARGRFVARLVVVGSGATLAEALARS